MTIQKKSKLKVRLNQQPRLNIAGNANCPAQLEERNLKLIKPGYVQLTKILRIIYCYKWPYYLISLLYAIYEI